MSRKSIKKNYIYNVTYQILLLLTPLITTPYVSRILGADGVGTYSFTNSITQYFVLFATMGISTFGQREISYCQDDRHRRSIVFWETKLLSLVSTALCLLVYFAFIFIQTENRIIYLILGISVVSVAFDVTWFFQGMEEFKKIVIRNTIIKIIDVAFIFLFVKEKSDLPIYVFGVVFFLFVGNISLWGYLPRYIEKPEFKTLKPFRNLKVVWSLFIPTIAIQIYTVMDKTMIGLFVDGSFENGYYEQAMKISKMALTLITALGSVMIPRIGYHFERGDTKEIRSYMYRGYNFVWFLGIPLCIGLIGISENFVPWFFGPGYERVADLLKISSFLILAIGINNVTGMQYLIPTKRQNTFTLTVVIGAGVNFILNLILIHFYQSIGAVIASVIAETVIALVQLYIVRDELKFSYILKLGWKNVIAGIIMGVYLILVGRQMVSRVMSSVILIGSGAVIYMLLLLMMKDKFLIENAGRALKKITSKLRRG